MSRCRLPIQPDTPASKNSRFRPVYPEVMMEKSKGFTLIELLVVIAIIALLLAIVMPALNFAKLQASGAVCLANLSGLSKGWHLYAMENDQKLVNGHTPRDTAYRDMSVWRGRGYLDNAWWVNPPHDETGVFTGNHPPVCSLDDEERGIRSGALFPYIENPKAYNCPGNRHYLSGDTIRRGGKRSYSITALMNGEMSGSNRNSQPVGGWRMANKVEEIRSPGDKVVFVEDIDPRGWNMGSWVIWNDNDWTDAVAVFHINRGTLGFADGHAEKRRWMDESTVYNGVNLLEGLRKPINWAGGEGEDYRFMRRAYVPMR